MKEMDKEKCYWCEWENVTSGGCMRCKPGTGYKGDIEKLGGNRCPGFEKWSMNKYARMHRDFLEENSWFEYETLLINDKMEERLMRVGKTAYCRLDDMMEAELKARPVPEGNILEVAGYKQNLLDSFEEIILAELVYRSMPFGGKLQTEI